MKVSFKVENAKFCRNHCETNDFTGYYGTEQVIEDFKRVMEYHELRFEKHKNEYISKWGQELWDKHVESYRFVV